MHFTIEKPLDRWRVTVDDHLVEYALNEGVGEKAWESIQKTRTPAVTPERYGVQGDVNGQVLDLRFPSPFAHTVAIYAKLEVAEVEKRGLTIGPEVQRELLVVNRGVLGPRFAVTLEDGWRHADAKEDALRRTTIHVEQIE